MLSAIPHSSKRMNRLLKVRMIAFDIKYSAVSDIKLIIKLSEAMEMVVPILMLLLTNNSFLKRLVLVELFHNDFLIQWALGVGH